MSWQSHRYYMAAQRVYFIIAIIRQTPHGFGTHYACVNAKIQLISYLRDCCAQYLSDEEYTLVSEAVQYHFTGDTVDTLHMVKSSDVTLQFLMDLTTHILYAKGHDVWGIIMTMERDNYETGL